MYKKIKFLLLFLIVENTMMTNGKTVEEDMAEAAEITTALHKACVEETGINEDLIKEANNKGEGIKDDKILKCYMKCLLEQMGVLSDDGIDYDILINLMPSAENKKVAEEVVAACRSEAVGDDLCEVAYKLGVCYKRTRPDKYVVF